MAPELIVAGWGWEIVFFTPLQSILCAKKLDSFLLNKKTQG
jgi:hypothetical protein